MEESVDDLKRREVQMDIRRLYLVVLDRLEEDSKNRLLDAKEVRLLSGNVLRSIRLYMKSMGWAPIKQPRKPDGSSSKKRWIERTRP